MTCRLTLGRQLLQLLEEEDDEEGMMMMMMMMLMMTVMTTGNTDWGAAGGNYALLETLASLLKGLGP